MVFAEQTGLEKLYGIVAYCLDVSRSLVELDPTPTPKSGNDFIAFISNYLTLLCVCFILHSLLVPITYMHGFQYLSVGNTSNYVQYIKNAQSSPRLILVLILVCFQHKN
jgi:hypothetical protein